MLIGILAICFLGISDILLIFMTINMENSFMEDVDEYIKNADGSEERKKEQKND